MRRMFCKPSLSQILLSFDRLRITLSGIEWVKRLVTKNANDEANVPVYADALVYA